MSEIKHVILRALIAAEKAAYRADPSPDEQETLDRLDAAYAAVARLPPATFEPEEKS